MSEKYSNGMFKTTSKLQDLVAGQIFTALYIVMSGITMSTNLDQISGDTLFTFEKDNIEVYKLIVDRNGKSL